MFRPVRRAGLLTLLVLSLFSAVPALASQAAFSVRGLGVGSIALNGHWRFRRGDDARWAASSLDDSQWLPIDISEPWGAQGYAGYTGFAWYRTTLDLDKGPDRSYALLIPPVDDAYQVYWNGKLIGGRGEVPPHARWYYTAPFTTMILPASGVGTLAVRVWKSPLLFVDPAILGGINGAPLLGDADSIAAQLAQFQAQSDHQFLYEYTLMVLYGFVTLLSLLLWSRDRRSKLLLWLAVFTATPIILSILQGMSPIQILISYGWGRGLNQPVYVLNHVSLWFLLLYLLRLDSHRALVRWTRVIATITVAAGAADGALAFFWAHAGSGMQMADALLTAVMMLVEIFPFVLIAFAVRERLELSRWLVAGTALASQMISIVADAGAAGQRFTHSRIFQFINTPLLIVDGVRLTAAGLAAILLFVSVLYAVYRYSMEQQARQSALEREMHSAQEIQRVLIPDVLPQLAGFAVTSAYRPALEVGGDFFQILNGEDGCTVIALGDVSGKGLKAAMNVSLIVGVLRSLSDANACPAEMLGKLNRCLYGRMQRGFATALILRLESNGEITLANAGHLPPMLNQREVETEGALPLGITPEVEYAEMKLWVRPGDQLSLYTDGLLEARSPEGELFGFERLHALFARRPTAQQALEAAVAFGQDDDITVLTLTRLASWQEPTTSLVAPALEPSAAEA